MNCEMEKITGNECLNVPDVTLTYKGQELRLCQKHFYMVWPYAVTKEDDDQSELQYQEDALRDILADWSAPYPGEPLEHWKLLMGKIDQLIEAAKEEGKWLHIAETNKSHTLAIEKGKNVTGEQVIVTPDKVALSPDVVRRLREDNSWTLSASDLLWQEALGKVDGNVELFKYEAKLGPDGWVILRKIEGDEGEKS